MDARRQLNESDAAQRKDGWKVGELAARTGLSVRALHHYEKIGLLIPSRRTGAGHRPYADEEVLRLQQIASLRALGLSLEEIRGCPDVEDYSPIRAIELHIARLRERVDSERRLCERLEGVAALLAAREGSAGGASAERFVGTVMEVTRMSENIEKYHTAEQLEQLERRKQDVGEERIQVRRFAVGLKKDLAAVEAGLTEPWSNGPVEGFVHKLKLLKMQGYGSAGFDLLKARMLAA